MRASKAGTRSHSSDRNTRHSGGKPVREVNLLRRHDSWRYNAQRKHQRDMRATQRFFADIHESVEDFRRFGHPYEDMYFYDHNHEVSRRDPTESWYYDWEAESLYSCENEGEISDDEADSDIDCGSMDGIHTSETDVLDFPVRADWATDSWPRDYDFQLFGYDDDDEIDFDNMSEIDPQALEGMIFDDEMM